MIKDSEQTVVLRRVLNVGGGSKAAAIPGYFQGWQHDLLDIDPRGNPDLLYDARELAQTKPRVYDAIYCSHNLEHYYQHDVIRVLAGFRLVLKKDGFADIRVPDVGAVMRAVAERELDIEDVLYHAPAGPIRVHDVIYGFGAEIYHSGNDFYAHKSGFTKKSLGAALALNGFPFVFAREENFEVAVLAFKQKPNDFQLQLLGLPQQTES